MGTSGVPGVPPGGFAVHRDAWGVPHVRAADELALARGQGYVTALDRGWQIEVDRWRAEGRLAERLGEPGLAWDRFAHRVRLADTARRAYAALAADDRAWVDAYTAGVNEGLVRGRDVPELRALADPAWPGGADLPPHEPWPAWAPLGVFLVAHVLFSGFPHVLWRDHVARTLGADLARSRPDVPLDAVLDLLAVDGGPGSGSNAWALAGGRTRSGAPLLAGDPHRLLELPGVYQQVRLACDDYDVVGLAFPGVPGLPHFGHAGATAWGVTNAMAYHVDVIGESLRRTDDGRVEARGPEGPELADVVVATVRVRAAGGPVEHRVETVETARGVVVTGGPEEPGRTFALRLPARVDADLGVAAWRRLLRARSARDVTDAFGAWVDPVDRVLAADRDTVLSVTAGRVPRRDRAERALPLLAWSDAARARPWLVPPAPVVVEDVAVDANERPGRPGLDLGHTYAPPHRARRIRALLDAAGDDGTAADQTRVHADTLLGGADDLLRWLGGSAAGGSGRGGETGGEGASGTTVGAMDGDPASARAARRLRAWDRRMDADSADAALFAAWRAALVRRVATHPALAPLRAPHGLDTVFAPWLSVTARVADALPALLGAAWLGIDGTGEAWAALREVVRAPAGARVDGPDGPDRVPPDPDGASTVPASTVPVWGATHRVLGLHVLLDVPGATAPRVPSLPLGGDTDTVCCTASVPGISDVCLRGSVARWAWDLADRDASRWGVPFGASGDPRSPHFADQLTAWAVGETVPVVTDWTLLRHEETR
ncbi:penicillin acylase family protein [Cellulosimicrobium cellulans]|uniref:penicillin acylase family protein n=1 Tax=Cellulosimicrobium cellulans TaxID=1710 RepID=UPI0020969E71|nr:penicillin acylase family protein [Cellulosimicrobium cellulans]MCO7271821.1 penicillin acylase family protein [Cellulosimicrobium cellulans]